MGRIRFGERIGLDFRSSHGPQIGTNRMKVKTRHKKSSSWKRKANSSPIAKGRRAKRKGRNPGKMKHIGGRGL